MKLVVVTGASSGIGRATAVRFAKAGWRVIAMARTRSALEELHKEAGDNVVVTAVDAADGDACAAACANVVAEFGVPDVVVNSAGLGSWKYLEETTPKELAQMMGAPFFAAAHVTGAFLSGMIARGSGRILHMGSPASYQPWPGSTAYATSRWALRGLHESLRADLGGTGVTSTHVVFGEVTSAYFDNNPGSHEHIPRVARLIPLSTPEQCADVLFQTATSTSAPPAAIIKPFMLWVFLAVQWIWPGVVRASVVETGRKREKLLPSKKSG